ncbi:MAG: hypothetical protein GEU93_19465 [Propionibacteriales bacterium]|nr:hypothetical protein [Propionibacteriales bacterium]
MSKLTDRARAARNTVYDGFVRHGAAPSTGAIAHELDVTAEEAEHRLHELHDLHAVALVPAEQLWRLAQPWYGDRLRPDWTRVRASVRNGC